MLVRSLLIITAFAVAPVEDENGDPVSLICMYGEERREFQQFEDVADGGRGEAG